MAYSVWRRQGEEHMADCAWLIVRTKMGGPILGLDRWTLRFCDGYTP
jgi:hypothetical protein